MSTAMTKSNGTNRAIAPAPAANINVMEYAGGMTTAQVELIKQAVITGGKRPVTDNELALFLTVCSRRGLDPFAGQVYGIMRKSKVDDTWVEKLVIQVGIDGYRLLAERTGKYEGMLGPLWCGADGQWVDVWLSDKPPAAAKVGILRAGCREPFWGTATYREFVQTYDSKPTGKWKDMPANMLGKCAEAAAIRKAFPQAVGGVTTPEMAGADTETFEITEGDRAIARIEDRDKTERASRGRQPWREEIDEMIDVPARVVEASAAAAAAEAPARRPTPPAAPEPDALALAIEKATNAPALEAVASAPGWSEEKHRPIANIRLVEIISAALGRLDWSRIDLVERSLAGAVIKLDPLPMDTPGLSVALDMVEDARQKMAELQRAGQPAGKAAA